MAGGNETQRSNRMELQKYSEDEGERHVFRKVEAQRSDHTELPKDSDEEGEHHVFRQVKAVTALRFVLACHTE
ncbi:MAG: hypothetical protein LBC02_12985 [Planctomycetaceae bacterium]|jgi:hypothetical protein|nr:hypothetical protein [Planctomycetaceae bacterium]